MSDLEEIVEEMYDCISKTDYSGEYMDYFAESIEAARKDRTCKVEYVSEWMGWHCKACDVLWQGLRDQAPHYCPRCGREVECEQ